MKTIDDYTTEELLKLTDEQIDKLYRLRLAENGIKIPNLPEKPNYEEEPQPDKTVYTVNGIDVYFEKKEVADKFADMMIKNMDDLCKLEYTYSVSPDAKYTEELKEDYGFRNGISISPKGVYSKALYNEIKDVLTRNKEKRDEYRNLKSEYDNQNSKASKHREYIMNKIKEAKKKEFEKSEMLRTFNEYLDLADGNSEIAWNFMNKAYELSEEDKTYINREIRNHQTGSDKLKIILDT